MTNDQTVDTMTFYYVPNKDHYSYGRDQECVCSGRNVNSSRWLGTAEVEVDFSFSLTVGSIYLLFFRTAWDKIRNNEQNKNHIE